jgi:2-oxoglutarate ferredoxin oxidoreductase subunit gamma
MAFACKACPVKRLAEKFGKHMVLNIIMVGFFAAVTNVAEPDSIRQAVADSVPPHCASRT